MGDWKLGIIGGTGRIACAVVCDLIRNRRLGSGKILLYGRSPEKLKRNLTLIARVHASAPSGVAVDGTHNIEEAIEGSNIILYNATPGLAASGAYMAFGINQGAHILETAQHVAKLAPEAWLMVDTNPTDLPVAAVHRRFGLRRVMGLCNATDIFQRVLSAYLGCAEKDLSLSEIGVNHEVFYLDILRNGVSVYEQLRRSLPLDYDPAKLRSAYLDSFPEWPLAFRNNVALMSACGFLTGPVGAPSRFQGLPMSGAELASMMKRPTDEDFLGLIERNAGPDEILRVIMRCGGGIPVYIARVLSGMLSDSPAKEAVQVLNEGILVDQPATAVLQVNCTISRHGVTVPKGLRLPEYVSAVLASRIRQSDMAARALAEQDEGLLRKALLVYPERVDLAGAERVMHGQERLERYMQLT